MPHLIDELMQGLPLARVPLDGVREYRAEASLQAGQDAWRAFAGPKPACPCTYRLALPAGQFCPECGLDAAGVPF